jgi:hypothetical protein
MGLSLEPIGAPMMLAEEEEEGRVRARRYLEPEATFLRL